MALFYINGAYVPAITIPGTTRAATTPATPPAVDADRLRGIPVDASGKADGKVLTYNEDDNTIEFTTVSGVGGDDTTIDGVDVDTSAKANGKVLTYNSSNQTIEFSIVPVEIPTQTGNNGKYLTTNGSAVSWADTPTEIPTPSGHSGEFLTNNGSAVSWAAAPTEIPTQTGNNGKFLTTNGSAVSWADVQAGGSDEFDTGSTTIYVATTGNDTTGDGSSGTPYATVARAMQDLPTVLRYNQTIDVADGTYAEAIDFRGFVCIGEAYILITGNTGTPGNVVFTGTTNGPGLEWEVGTQNYGCFALGDVRGFIQGITINLTTAHFGAGIQQGASLIVDRCVIKASSPNGISNGVLVAHDGEIEFRGNVTIQNFENDGLQVFYGSRAYYKTAGTLTITRPDSFGIGIHVFGHSSFIIYTDSTNITIFGVKIGWQLGLNALFQHRGATSTLTATNTNTPTPSAGIQCTDLSSWSTTNTVTLDHFQYGFEANSVSYIEATGTKNLSNISNGPNASQSSVIYLP